MAPKVANPRALALVMAAEAMATDAKMAKVVNTVDTIWQISREIVAVTP